MITLRCNEGQGCLGLVQKATSAEVVIAGSTRNLIPKEPFDWVIPRPERDDRLFKQSWRGSITYYLKKCI